MVYSPPITNRSKPHELELPFGAAPGGSRLGENPGIGQCLCYLAGR
jgi:hypothetical protein